MKNVYFIFAILVSLVLFVSSSLQEEESKTVIHLIGDSTMAPKDLSGQNPERGWGMMFPNFLDDGIKVVNYARNGRSTKSFMTLGHWDEVEKNLKKGDYLFIQFGHNDSKKSDTLRYADAWGAYQENLRHYIRVARDKGAIPVLLTPVSRRWFKDGRLDENCLEDYPQAMREVAKEEDVILLDITSATMDWLKELGDSASREYFMWVKPGTVTAMPEGKTDNTHTNARGARKVARIVCGEIAKYLPEIASHFVYYDIVVAQDGTGDYFTVQEAIDACPDYSHDRYTNILVKNGVYDETVTIPHNKFRIRIVGESADSTVITGGKYAKMKWPDRDFTVGTSGSASIYIHSSYVVMENLTIMNTAGEGKDIGQAVALFTNGDFLFFKNCRIIANQDTIYTYGRYNKEGGVCRNYFLDCYIEGTTDFIFGPSIAYFENCTIHSKKNSYITAASTFEGQKYGYVFHKCRLTADEGVDKVYLGRPWRPYARTVFIECELGAHIAPEGWKSWPRELYPSGEGTAYYAEYKNYGPGAGTSKRVKWSRQLTAKQAEEYSFEKVMAQSGDPEQWKPETMGVYPVCLGIGRNESVALRMAESEMSRCKDATWLDGMEGTLKWNYTTGLELTAFLEVYKEYGGEDIFNYVLDWYNQAIDTSGTIYKYKKSNFNVDHICPGNALFYLYERTGEERFKTAMDTLWDQLADQPRTPEGGFWHKKVYPNQMWLDGLYMAQPYYAHYAYIFGDQASRAETYEDVINNLLIVAEHTYDPSTKLYRHAWDSSKEMFWCDPETGQSAHAWGRALGWYVMGIVDVLDFIPENTPGREKVIEILQGIYKVLPDYADKTTGMWYQVLDCPGREGNYLEATCSAMFSYALLKGVRKGYLDPSLKEYAVETYNDFMECFVVEEDGLLTVKDCCEVAGLGGKENRSGKYDYYINEKIRDNDPKGVGPFIMASLEYEELSRR